jgi:hypothetical protein
MEGKLIDLVHEASICIMGREVKVHGTKVYGAKSAGQKPEAEEEEEVGEEDDIRKGRLHTTQTVEQDIELGFIRHFCSL